MKLVKKTRSPFWWYDFYFEGKRYRASTGEKTKAAANTFAANALTRLTEGSTLTKRSHRAPSLREFSKRFLLVRELQHPQTQYPPLLHIRLAPVVFLGTCLDAHRPDHGGNN
jgi:hypothetical protein